MGNILISQRDPSWPTGFARSASDAKYPGLWDGLVGLWAPGLGPTGLSLYDVSGQSNHGALTDMDPATDWVAGEKGWNLEFDGVAGVVTIDTPLFAESGPLTTSVWVNTKSESIAKFLHLGLEATGDGTEWDWTIEDVSGAHLIYRHGGGSIRFAGVVLDTWHHFAMVIPNVPTPTTDDVIVFIDGVQVSGTRNSGSDRTINISEDAILSLGGKPLHETFDGFVLSNSLYDRALSPAEIRLHASDHLAPLRQRPRIFPVPVVEEVSEEPAILIIPRRSEPAWSTGFARGASQALHPELWDGLVGLWAPGLGPTGLSLYDVSGHSNHGSLENMDANTDWVTGENGWGLEFDGVNQRIDLLGASVSGLAPQTYLITVTRLGTEISEYVLAGQDGGDITMLAWFNTSVNEFEFQVLLSGDNLRYRYSNFISVDEQVHIVIVWDGLLSTESVQVYRNGQAVIPLSTQAGTGSWPGYSDIYLAGRPADDTRNFEGRVVETVVYNRALSPSEIQLLASDHLAPLRQRSRIFPALTTEVGENLFPVFIVEAGTSDDTVSVLMLSPQYIVEGGTSDDAVIRTISTPVFLTEDSTSSSTYAQTLTTTVLINEGAESTEGTSRTLISPQNILEAAESDDTDIASLLIAVSITEGTQSTDAFTLISGLVGLITESAQSADTYENLLLAGAILTEASSSSDILASAMISPQAIVEAATSGDSNTGGLGITVVLTESCESSDAFSNVGILNVVVQEDTISDDTYINISIIVTAITEDVISTDTFIFQAVPITSIIAATFILPVRDTTFILPIPNNTFILPRRL